MADRRIFHIALLCWLSLAQNGHTATDRWPVGPVDSGAEFRVNRATAVYRTDAPNDGDLYSPILPSVAAPQPEPAPALITTPVIEVPALTPLGEPIVATLRFDPPADSRVKVEWKTPTVATLPNGNWGHYIWAKPGKHIIGAMVVVVTPDDIAVYSPSAELVVGDPPPPEPDKPLASLVTKEQAEALAKLYRAMATLPPPEDFWQAHDAALEARGLTGHGATAQIRKRLDVVLADAVKLKAELLKIADELAKPAPDPPPPVDPNVKITAVTYVYEKDDTAVPAGVSTGLNRLNREKNIRATLFEEDTVDGDGDVPDQYKAALTAATEAGLPALVATAGSTVVNVVKDPRTEAQVWGIAP